MRHNASSETTGDSNIDQLQALIDRFRDDYNQTRPHRSLPHRATPATTYSARPKATPGTDRSTEIHYRVLHDIIDKDGKLTLRLNGRLHHIGIGAENRRTPVLKIIDDHHVRVVHAATGEILRELTPTPTTSP